MNSRLQHANIVGFYGTFSDVAHVYIVTEYCSGGELWELCKSVGEPEYRAKVYFSQIIDAVWYMHRMGLVHRDLKAENVLLTSDLQTIKLCDFGSCRDIYNPHIRGSGTPNRTKRGSSFEHYVGTPNFLSPEAISNTENDCVSDIWSLGCTFYQILCGIPPFVAGSEYLIYIRVRARDIQIPSKGLSESAIALINFILQIERSERPKFPDILTHEFFQNLPNRVPEYTSDDKLVRAIVRNNAPVPSTHPSQYFSDRLALAHTVENWKGKSAPGTGIAIMEHLLPHVPELALLKQMSDELPT